MKISLGTDIQADTKDKISPKVTRTFGLFCNLKTI